VNHRVHPGQTVSEVVERDRKSIKDDRVKMAIKSKMDPHEVSPFGPDDLAYQLIATSVYQSFEQVVVAPCKRHKFRYAIATQTLHANPITHLPDTKDSFSLKRARANKSHDSIHFAQVS
jgi:hypothetical protein